VKKTMEYGSRPMGNFSAPVKVGDEFDVKIEAVGEKGDGLAKKDGFVLFVPNTKEGDEVHIKVSRVLRKVGFAEVVGEASGPVDSGEAPAEAGITAPQEQAEVEVPQDSEDFGDEAPAQEGQVAEESSEEEAKE
jgi:predicted RNA-binding protein with TRAM domain